MRDLLWLGWRRDDVVEAEVANDGTLTIRNLSLSERMKALAE
jgi:hypothetical protein